MFHEIFNYPIPYWSNIPVPAPGCCIYPAAAMISSGWTADCHSTAAGGAGGNFGNHNHITNTGFTSTLLHNNQSFLFFRIISPPAGIEPATFLLAAYPRPDVYRDGMQEERKMKRDVRDRIVFYSSVPGAEWGSTRGNRRYYSMD